MLGAPRLGRVRQISQHAEDLDRAVAFYGDVLGLTPLGRFGPLAFFDLSGTRLLLEEGGGSGPGGSVIYFAVDDIHAASTELRRRGVSFEDEPHRIHRDDQGIFGPAGEEEWMTFFRDSEGNLLALSSRIRPA